jgi:hypothetical protein
MRQQVSITTFRNFGLPTINRLRTIADAVYQGFVSPFHGFVGRKAAYSHPTATLPMGERKPCATSYISMGANDTSTWITFFWVL